MTPALLLLALAAEPSVTVDVEPDVPRLVVSVYPGGVTAGAAYGLTKGTTDFYLPLGLSIPLRADLSLDIDVSASYNKSSFGAGGSFLLSAGPTWFPFAKKGLDGFFIGPRFQLEISQPTPEPIFFDSGSGAPLTIDRNVRRAFLVGLDVGWQFRVGRVVFGPIAGVSYGYAWTNSESVISPFDEQVLLFTRPMTDGFAPSVNLTLFKVGGVF